MQGHEKSGATRPSVRSRATGDTKTTILGRMSRVRRTAAVFLFALALSGCVSRYAGPGSTAETTTTTSTERVSTADGTDLTACADGTCEVLLTARTSAVPVPGGTVTVTVDGRRVEYEVSLNGGSASGSAEGSCVVTFDLDGSGTGSVCHAGGPTPDPDPGPGEMAMVVSDEGPVLRLVTGS